MRGFFYFYTVPKLKRFLIFLKQFYQLDVRALALMRVGLAIVILADLFIRAQDLTAFFTDDGFWSTRLLHTYGWQPGYWSLHTLNGSYGYTVMLFCLHAIAALFLLLGYKTRLFTIIVWAFTVSLHNRNLFILQSGDDLLRLTLFWAIFLPWGNALSIDSKKYATRKHHFSIATMGYLVLIASVYFFTVCFKNSAEWRQNGSAIYYALSLDQLRLPLGDWLYQYPHLMKLLTYVVLFIEILIPILILFPTKKGWSKTLAFLLLLLLHINIGLTLYVGLFYIINITTALALLPSSFFDKYSLFLIHNVDKLKRKTNPLGNYISSIVTSFVVVLCLILNLSYMQWFNYELTRGMSSIINVLRLNQYWGMFSPHIMKEDGWYVYEGFTETGKHWDLKQNTPYINADKPKHLVKHYKSDRWRKLAENIQRNEYTFLRPMFCKFKLNQWNLEHPDNKMKSLNLLFYEETTDSNYKVKPIQRIQFCFCVTND